MLLPRRVAGRTLGLHGPDLARGPEVARICSRGLMLSCQEYTFLTIGIYDLFASTLFSICRSQFIISQTLKKNYLLKSPSEVVPVYIIDMLLDIDLLDLTSIAKIQSLASHARNKEGRHGVTPRYCCDKENEDG